MGRGGRPVIFRLRGTASDDLYMAIMWRWPLFICARVDAQPVEPAPRYDEVFEQGTAWLDSLAGGDPLHPTGRCTCHGEGRCEWCRKYEEPCSLRAWEDM